MFHLVLGIHLLLCVVLIGLVLLQQGKGASMGAAFGGSSNTVFGAAGAGTMLTKVTTIIAVCFMATSIFLVRYYTSLAESAGTVTVDPLHGSVMGKLAQPSAQSEAPAAKTEQASAQGEVVPVAPQKVEAPPSDAAAKK
ncbi:MAG: preprotein translocase subunit SecG [Deltaproteobacteria bacterium]|nr:preprotein translocase subunit SecG [Deltaproteobacteria bacterium]